jgi:cytochrome c biogenesis factor
MPAVDHTRSLAGIVAELKQELKDFLQTRIQILRSEVRDKLRAWKLALPLAALGVVLLATCWLVLTAALVAVLAAAFYPSRFAYFFALAIVGAAYFLGGALCVAFAVREMREQGILPQRTLKVLKEDAVWLRSEARSQI